MIALDAEREGLPHVEQPFGTYRTSPLQERLLRFTRVMPDTPTGRRAALAIRPLIIRKDQPVVDSEIDNVRFRFHLSDNVCERRLFLTPYQFDPMERRWLESALPQGGCFVDIGANAGLYSLLMTNRIGRQGRIIAIEPQAEVFDRLVTNVRLNSFSHITTLCVGVSDHVGELTLFKNHANRGAASVTPGSRWNEAVTIRVEPLMKILAESGIARIDALKIDVERHEDAAMAPFLQEAGDGLLPTLIVTENSRGHWKRDWIAMCLGRGYRVAMENRRNVVLDRRSTAGAATLSP